MEGLSRVYSQLDRLVRPKLHPIPVSFSLLLLHISSSLPRLVERFFYSPYCTYKILNGAISCESNLNNSRAAIVTANLCIFLHLKNGWPFLYNNKSYFNITNLRETWNISIVARDRQLSLHFQNAKWRSSDDGLKRARKKEDHSEDNLPKMALGLYISQQLPLCS